jgi:hypothetical protein
LNYLTPCQSPSALAAAQLQYSSMEWRAVARGTTRLGLGLERVQERRPPPAGSSHSRSGRRRRMRVWSARMLGSLRRDCAEQRTLPIAEHRAARGNQRVEIELLAIDASPDGLCALTIAIGAPHVHLPAEASRRAQRFDMRTKVEQRPALVKPPARPAGRVPTAVCNSPKERWGTFEPGRVVLPLKWVTLLGS